MEYTVLITNDFEVQRDERYRAYLLGDFLYYDANNPEMSEEEKVGRVKHDFYRLIPKDKLDEFIGREHGQTKDTPFYPDAELELFIAAMRAKTLTLLEKTTANI
jgi:hypothetical protein